MRTRLLTMFATLAMLMCSLTVSAEAITSISQLSNGVLYHVSTPRGARAVSEYGTTPGKTHYKYDAFFVPND